ncbi:Phosphatidate phosphatase APP1 [Pleurostoma richardsiae]|uniref:Phosphatidate phosphatase APP1 n=1 Tax=Pleurostoma richardsiae TaxID=41990 RepID=A0AA38RSW6_9PEZI|nr:Phosphatidate phosphatase APP1 [Pleurostoma richardsiae]
MLRAAVLLLFSTAATVAAVPAPHPEITAPPTLTQQHQRDLVKRLDVGSYVDSVFSDLGSGVSSFIASGVPQFFNDLPTGTAVESSLGISSSDLAATPTQALNVPAYANWTDQGWNVRIHGNIFKQPNISRQRLNELANVFLIDVDITELPQSQQDQARNLTSEIFVVQQDNEQVTVDFVNDVTVEPSTDSGAINAAGGAQNITMPYNTTREGDFDAFVVLQNTTGPNGGHLLPGNETSQVQTLNMYVEGTDTGNATAYLVPEEGVTVISDIDDILRVTKIYDPKEGLLNSFARPFTPWMNMPEIYANWSSSFPNFHFHYLTTTPEQVTKNYMDYIYKTYPLGSFDTRPLNFSDVSATLAIRKYLLNKVFQTFPQRRFVLVADTSNSDVMKDYPQMVTDFPGQVLCILLRNTSATDSDDLFPYDTSGFKNVNDTQYMFFRVPDDLAGLDIVGGQCVNSTFRQNVTFGEQGLPFGLGSDNAAGRLAPPTWWWTLGGCVFMMLMMTGVGF